MKKIIAILSASLLSGCISQGYVRHEESYMTTTMPYDGSGVIIIQRTTPVYPYPYYAPVNPRYDHHTKPYERDDHHRKPDVREHHKNQSSRQFPHLQRNNFEEDRTNNEPQRRPFK